MSEVETSASSEVRVTNNDRTEALEAPSDAGWKETDVLKARLKKLAALCNATKLMHEGALHKTCDGFTPEERLSAKTVVVRKNKLTKARDVKVASGERVVAYWNETACQNHHSVLSIRQL